MTRKKSNGTKTDVTLHDVIRAVEAMDHKMDTRFDAVDARFDAVDARIGALDKKVDRHYVEHKARDQKQEQRLTKVEQALRSRRG